MEKFVHLEWLINQNYVLSKLNNKEKNLLLSLAIRKVVNKGDTLAWQGSEWHSVLIISSGLLRSVIYAPDGRRHVVSTWRKGDDFWSHTTLDNDPLLASLEAAKHSTIYQWPGEAVLDLVIHNPAATLALLYRQTQLIRKRRENIYNLVFNQTTSRVAKLIIDQFSKEELTTVQRDLTLIDLAEMAATSPEGVCRILYRFQEQGFLQLTRASITLKNREALENLSSGIDAP